MACSATVNLVSHFASGTYGHPSSNIEYHKEGVRLVSFSNFPKSVPVSTIRLSQAGFFYTGERDVVRCFSCGVTYGNWKKGDRPTEVHAHISPNCPLVQGIDTSNLSLPMPVTILPNFPGSGPDSGYGTSSFNSLPSSTSSSQALDRAGAPSVGLAGQVQTDVAVPSEVPDSGPLVLSALLPPVVNSQASTADSGRSASSSLTVPDNGTAFGASSVPPEDSSVQPSPMPARRLDLGRAVYPLYSQMDARKRSFTNWDESRGLPSRDELIGLGFFYAGYADCVRCFFCGIGLKSWEPGDIPAEVHAKWRPTCEYLRLVKGDAFVDQVANAGSSNGGRDAPSTSSSTEAAGVQIPDLPIVQRAWQMGYNNEQISEGILKLRSIGMERAADVLLVDVLNNLYRDSLPQPQVQLPQNSDNTNSNRPPGEGDSDSITPAVSDDLQRDGEGPNRSEPDSHPALNEQEELQQENARLREMRTCLNCRERMAGSIFLPCGHIVVCTVCAPTIRHCTRCQTLIRATANVYFS